MTLKGFQHTLGAPNQSSGGTAYTFASWSDGGAQSHGIVVPTGRPELHSHLPGEFGPGRPGRGLLVRRGCGHERGRCLREWERGSIGTAAWSTAGKYGNALSFNGRRG